MYLHNSQISGNEKYVHKLHKIKLDLKITEVLSHQTLIDDIVMQKEFEQEYFES